MTTPYSGRTTILLMTRTDRLRVWLRGTDWYQAGALLGLGALVAGGLAREALRGGHEQARAAAPGIVILDTAQPALVLWAEPSPTPPLALIQPPAAAQPALNLPEPTAAAGGTVTTAQAPRGLPLPPGKATLHQNPDASYYTVEGSQTRYYLDASGAIVEARLPGAEPAAAAAEPAGAPPEQKIFLDPSNPADAAYLAAQPTAAPARGCSGRCIHPPSK